MTSFTMRNPPRYPQRKTNVERVSGDIIGLSVDELVDLAEKLGVPTSDAQVDYYIDRETDCTHVRLRFFLDESDAEYNQRLEVYQKEMAEYKEWEAQNAENIKEYEAELDRARIRAERKRLVSLKAHVKSLEQDLQRYKRDIEISEKICAAGKSKEDK